MAGTVAAWAFQLDVRISALFYDPLASPPWLLGNSQFARAVEASVWIPGAAIIVAAGVLVFLAARRGRSYVRAELILLISLLVGPVLLGNLLLKPRFHRPRPEDITEFGGREPFRPVLEPRHRSGASFPSGHASAAFALMLPFFALHRTRRRLALAFLITGLCYGGFVGVVRIAHGRHFFTDVLWAGAIVWFAGYGVAALVRRVLPDAGVAPS